MGAKEKYILVFLSVIFVAKTCLGQCEIRERYREDGTNVKIGQMRKVAESERVQLAFSISYNGTDFFLNAGIRGDIGKVTGPMRLVDKKDQIISAELVRSQKTRIGGELLLLVVYRFSEEDVRSISRHEVKTASFKSSNGVMDTFGISSNGGILSNQIECISKK